MAPPVNKPSQLLSDEINSTIFTKMLKPNCTSLVTTLATFAYNFNGRFGPKTAGILCFEKDSSSGLHYLRLYNMDTNQMFFDELVGPRGIEFTSDDPPSMFEIQFASGINIGLWFLPEPEAEAEARDLEKAFLSVCMAATSPARNTALSNGSKAKKKNRKGVRARRRERQRATKAAESLSKTQRQTQTESSEDQSDEEAMNLMDTLKEQLLARQLADLKEIKAKKDAKQLAGTQNVSQTKTALPSTSKKPLPPPTIVVQPPSPQKSKPTTAVINQPKSPQKPNSPTPVIVVQPPSPQKLTPPTAIKQPQSPQKSTSPTPTTVVQPPSPQKPKPQTATKQPQSAQKPTSPTPATVVQPPSPQKPAIKKAQSPQKNVVTQLPSSEQGKAVKSPGRQVKFEDDDADFQATQDIAAKWQQKRADNQKNARQGG